MDMIVFCCLWMTDMIGLLNRMVAYGYCGRYLSSGRIKVFGVPKFDNYL